MTTLAVRRAYPRFWFATAASRRGKMVSVGLVPWAADIAEWLTRA